MSDKKRLQIDYLELLKKAWNITWNNKSLWWFGLILSIGGGMNFNFSGGNIKGEEMKNEKINQYLEYAKSFVYDHWDLILAGITLLFLLLILLAVIKVISRGGIIKSIAEINKGKEIGFRKGFVQGKKYFWKLFLMNLAISFFILFAMAVLSMPIIYLFLLKSYALGVILMIIAILIAIAIFVLVSFIREYSSIYIVMTDLGVRNSLENAVILFRKNVIPSIIFYLIMFACGFAVGIGVVLLIFSLAIIVIPIGFGLNKLFDNYGIYAAVTLGALIVLAILLLIQAVFETFRQASWVLFFEKIASIREKEGTSEEKIKIEQKVLDAGEA